MSTALGPVADGEGRRRPEPMTTTPTTEQPRRTIDGRLMWCTSDAWLRVWSGERALVTLGRVDVCPLWGPTCTARTCWRGGRRTALSRYRRVDDLIDDIRSLGTASDAAIPGAQPRHRVPPSSIA